MIQPIEASTKSITSSSMAQNIVPKRDNKMTSTSTSTNNKFVNHANGTSTKPPANHAPTSFSHVAAPSTHTSLKNASVYKPSHQPAKSSRNVHNHNPPSSHSIKPMISSSLGYSSSKNNNNTFKNSSSTTPSTNTLAKSSTLYDIAAYR
jgi:hypothetical protein